MKDYFARMLKSKLIKVEIAIRYSSAEIISAAVTSEDINSINNRVIENVRFEFVKRQILKPDPGLSNVTIDNLLGQNPGRKALFSSDQQVIDDILNSKNGGTIFI